MSFGLRGVIGVEGESCTGGNSSLIHQGLPDGRIQAELRRTSAAHCRLTLVGVQGSNARGKALQSKPEQHWDSSGQGPGTASWQGPG